MRQAMLEGHAAPWNGGSLTPFERELLVQWVDGGAPERPKFNPDDYSRSPAAFVRISAANPLAALDAHHAARGGTREIIPGLGLALRTADEILVFERGAGAGERIIARGTIVPSLAAHLATLAPDIARTRVSDAAYIIGIATDPRIEVAEIPLEGPDRFWCPMHPDVRSPGPGTCVRCAMTLVEMPPLSLDTFNLDVVKTEPLPHHAVRLTLRVTRGPQRLPVTSFITTHERPFHLFLLDTNGRFEHLHPEVAGNELIAVSHLPRSRAKWIIGDFLPHDGLPQLLMAQLAAERIELEPIEDLSHPPTVKMVLNEGERRAGLVSRLAFAVTDSVTSAAPMNLEPYLGAAAHLFVIDAARQEALHAHPVDLPQTSLASPTFDVRFPRDGRYDMWLQVQRAGRVETLRFTVDVSK